MTVWSRLRPFGATAREGGGSGKGDRDGERVGVGGSGCDRGGGGSHKLMSVINFNY